MSKCVIIIQQAKSTHGGSFLLETKTIDLDNGEVVAKNLMVRPGFSWDNAIEGALNDAVKHAESAGFNEIRVDSPFTDAIKARQKLLNELRD